MDMEALRQQIDEIDGQLVDLFCRRMAVAARIADYKRENGIPILASAREEEILKRVSQQAGEELSEDVKKLYQNLFQISRDYQHRRNTEVVK